MWPALREAYADGVFDVFRRYWRAYGGIRALALSPYFHVAALLTALLAPYWLHQPWWDVALSAMPSLLGFTLAGFTIWLGLGSPRLRELMSRPGADGAPSVYVQVAATFVHFVVTQILALLLALVAKALDFVPAVAASVQVAIAHVKVHHPQAGLRARRGGLGARLDRYARALGAWSWLSGVCVRHHDRLGGGHGGVSRGHLARHSALQRWGRPQRSPAAGLTCQNRPPAPLSRRAAPSPLPRP